MKEKLLDYVRVDGDSQVFLLTDQRVVIVSSDEGKPLSIPLHREPRRPLAARKNRKILQNPKNKH